MGKNYRKTRAEKAERGECYLCSKPSAEGSHHCEFHLSEMRARTKAWREGRMKKGLCVQCGAPKGPEKKGKRLCRACLTKMAERKRQATARRRAEA